VLEQVGVGKFGEVFKGLWNETTLVALKKMRQNKTKEFDTEVATLSKLQHKNIVHFFGIYCSKTGDRYIVLEYMPQGNLQQLLRRVNPKPSADRVAILALQTANGMVYLHSNFILHRDLALRNLLVSFGSDGEWIVKVSDFGLSRESEEDYYKLSTKAGKMFPLKWSPPEFLQFSKFTSKSDVFSFGILLWELFSYGSSPYVGISNAEAVDKVLEGYRMSPPPHCPAPIAKLMNICWKEDPESRPTFKVKDLHFFL